MKTLSAKSLVVAICTMLVAFNSISKLANNEISFLKVLTYPVILPNIEIEAPILPPPIVISQHELFLEAIGFKESGNDYKAVNRFGYLGRYQFGRATLNNLGYRDINNRAFLSDPELQEQVMLELLQHNYGILKRYIEKYDGKVVHGIEVTTSGILAAAHLAGPRNVKRWFNSGKDFKDGFGTKLSTYLENFSGYELEL